ncbi:hypothetical protein [Actinophytocola sp.]|uniref:hypothetical protein n=1 Tax=Actinophytocola sp. TaxID=1872138 RepID=UPI0025C628ED|nr:hypothetical protein [Actinophytocola sp.]
MAAGYESFYLRACRPEGGLGVWVRYTVHRRKGHPPVGSLWFTLFDAEAAGPVATKVTLPGPVAEDWVRIGDARFGPGRAVGSANDVSWDLRFTGADPLHHLPQGWMYKSPLPRTKPVSPHPVARFDGTVTVGGREIALTGWPGMVGHNWGSQHAERWIWLHGMAFDGAGDDTWLDVTIGRLRLAGRTSPWIAAGAVSVAGERLALGGPGRPTRVTESPDRLEFALAGRDVVVAGVASAPRERFVGWVYADPDGSEHHTVNCSIADLLVRVARPNTDPVELRAPGRAAYELGMRERDHGIPIQPFTDG